MRYRAVYKNSITVLLVWKSDVLFLPYFILVKAKTIEITCTTSVVKLGKKDYANIKIQYWHDENFKFQRQTL